MNVHSLYKNIEVRRILNYALSCGSLTFATGILSSNFSNYEEAKIFLDSVKTEIQDDAYDCLIENIKAIYEKE